MAINKYQTRTIVKVALFAVAMSIVALSLLYTDNLAKNLKEDERSKVALWAEATRLIATLEVEDETDVTYALSVIRANNTIPVIVTLEDGTVIAHRNIDSASAEDKVYIQDRNRRV